MLTRIKIVKLFDLFDYNIELKEEGITILTGPNGYGKTTVLKILDALAVKNGLFFVKLPFQEISFTFEKGTVTIEKINENEIQVKAPHAVKHSIIFSKKKIIEVLRDRFPFLHAVGEDRWMDHSSGRTFDIETLQKDDSAFFPGSLDNLLSIKIPIFLDVYLIREQRLLRPIKYDSQRRISPLGGYNYADEKKIDAFTKTIEEYAKELQDIIEKILAKSSQVSQKLDSSFPHRLFTQKQEVSNREFDKRFSRVKKTQAALGRYGLSDIKEDSHPTYKPENAKALYVYINDMEKKLAVFSSFLEKIKIFTDILNERRFAFKRINISKEHGFKFSTVDGKPLALGDLSSGEQQEVVLFYELLFKVKPGTLVLIDEPEISLHVAWQKQFLDDLFKIIKLQKINVIIATHSPQIINDHWDLTVDLEEISQCGSI
ncbi:MAG: AAA family ATPase [Candidatus Methylumidiphilus sp.]